LRQSGMIVDQRLLSVNARILQAPSIQWGASQDVCHPIHRYLISSLLTRKLFRHLEVVPGMYLGKDCGMQPKFVHGLLSIMTTDPKKMF
jgi:hypothetical protein